jgi:hypothetical protein
MTASPEEVFARRQRYWANGYRPLEVWSADQRVNDKGDPLKSPGKQPRGKWREQASRNPPAAIENFPDARALNTGVLCGEVVAFDVDVPIQDLADQTVHLIEHNLGPTPLVRVGMAPKILLVYRPESRFSKVQTPELVLPNAIKVKVELLAEGQQFVADGTHPDTGQPYTWTGGTPEDVPIAVLPVITEAQARDVINEAERLLHTVGAREKEKPRQEHKPNRCVDGLFGQVNTAALANIEAWVRALFPRARLQPGTGAWRVSSGDLGRDLEEDISIHPEGIWDFGEEAPLTAVDLVMRYADVEKAIDAALWLCGNLGIAPETLGYTGGRPRQQSPPQGISLNDFHAYMPMHSYIYASTREMWPVASVNARIPPVAAVDAGGHPVLDQKSKQRMLPANLWLDQNKPVEQMTWAPGRPMLIRNWLISDGGWMSRSGVTCFNLYRPPIIDPVDPAIAAPWLSHVLKVFPDDANHILKWLAHRVQRPQEKINHAIVLGGKQGIGKDSLLEPVKPAIGPWNFVEVSPLHVLGRFNGFVKSVILRVNEARDLGAVDRFQFYDHMKSYIAAPPDVLRVDEKNLREYSVINCCGVIITTNHKTDGIFLPADDRRHYVAWSDLAKEDFSSDYWAKLWAWYENGGDRHVAAYLAQLDISAFDPKAPPPKTAAFWDIVDANRAPEDAELADVLDRLANPDAASLSEIIRGAGGDFADWLTDRKNRRIIPHRLEACDYVPVRNPAATDGLWKVHGRRQVVYAKVGLPLRDRLSAAQNLISSAHQ